MPARTAARQILALAALVCAPAQAGDRSAAALLQRARDPGPAIRRAAIDSDYTYRVRPEPHDIEAEARNIERQALAEGRGQETARSMADAHRRFGRVAAKGLLLRASVTYRYDRASWAYDQRGRGVVNGERYREAWFEDGKATYQLMHTSRGCRVTITPGPRPNPMALGPAIFFRRPQGTRLLRESSLERAGRDAEGRQILQGTAPSILPENSVAGSVTLWVDARHGCWPARLETRTEDALVERCVATGFRKWPGGVWFPTRVVDEMFVTHGPEKGAVRLSRTYEVRAARFNEKAGAPPGPPALDGPTTVTDYRFQRPVLYNTSGSYRPAVAVQRKARLAAFRHALLRGDGRVLTLRWLAALVMVSLALTGRGGRRRRRSGQQEAT